MSSRRAVYKPPPAQPSGLEKFITTLTNTLYGKPADSTMHYQDQGMSKGKINSKKHDDGLTTSERWGVYKKDLEHIVDEPLTTILGDDNPGVTAGVKNDGRRPNSGNFQPEVTNGVKPLSNDIRQGINGHIYDLGLPADEEGVPEGNSTWVEKKIDKPVDLPKDPAPPVNPKPPKKPKFPKDPSFVPLPLDDADDFKDPLPPVNPKNPKKFKGGPESNVTDTRMSEAELARAAAAYLKSGKTIFSGKPPAVPRKKHKRKSYGDLLKSHQRITSAPSDRGTKRGRYKESAKTVPAKKQVLYRHTDSKKMAKRRRSRTPARKRTYSGRKKVYRRKSSGSGGRKGGGRRQMTGLYQRYASLGSFPVMQNSLVRTALKASLVFNKVSKPSSVRVRHREYVMDIMSITALNTLDLITPVKINAGLERSFPWLSAIAAGFETFKFHGLVYEFKSLSGDVTTGSNQGFVCAAIDYNPTSPTWTTKSQIENAEGSVSSKPSKDFMIVAECAPAINTTQEFYCTQGALLSTQPPQLYSLGELNVGMGGYPTGNVPLYELWCAYDVELSSPHQLPAGSSTQSAHYNLGILAAASPLGLAANRVQVFDTIGLTLSNTAFTLPAGVGGAWQMTLFSAGTAAACTPPTITYTNCTGQNIWLASNGNYEATETGDNTTTYMAVSSFKVTNPQLVATVTFGGAGAFPTGTVLSNFILTELNPALVA